MGEHVKWEKTRAFRFLTPCKRIRNPESLKSRIQILLSTKTGIQNPKLSSVDSLPLVLPSLDLTD